jgi:hypothetical protein
MFQNCALPWMVEEYLYGNQYKCDPQENVSEILLTERR